MGLLRWLVQMRLSLSALINTKQTLPGMSLDG